MPACVVTSGLLENSISRGGELGVAVVPQHLDDHLPVFGFNGEGGDVEGVAYESSFILNAAQARVLRYWLYILLMPGDGDVGIGISIKPFGADVKLRQGSGRCRPGGLHRPVAEPGPLACFNSARISGSSATSGDSAFVCHWHSVMLPSPSICKCAMPRKRPACPMDGFSAMRMKA